MTIEFLGPDGTPQPADEELLDIRPPRRSRGWLVLAAAVAALVTLAGVFGSMRGGGSPAAEPTGSAVVPPSYAAPTGLVPYELPIDTFASAVELDSTAIVAAGGVLFWLSLDRPLPAPALASSELNGDDSYTLIADPARHQVWALRTGDVPEVGIYTSSGPARQFTYGFPAPLAGGAMLDGHLYVTTSTGVVRLDAHGGGFSVDWTPVRGGREIAADPSRHRLLLVDADGARPTLRAQRPNTARPERTVALPFGKGEVAVTGNGQIWAAGYGTDGAVLARLDPSSLRVVATSRITPQLGPGAIVAGVGRQVLLVRDGETGVGLWCVDARTGEQLSYWPEVTGTIAFGPDGAFALRTTRETPLQLTGGRCSG